MNKVLYVVVTLILLTLASAGITTSQNAPTCIDDVIKPCGSNVGVCSSGIRTCVGGEWAECIDDIGPEEEVCNSLDDDCDSLVDEGGVCVQLTCTNGRIKPCGSNVGVCSSGIRTCVGGEWAECIDDIGPFTEMCDGLDNDCDGSVDEGCTLSKSPDSQPPRTAAQPGDDFKVQRGVATMSVTGMLLFAPADFDAVSSLSNAFVRITNTHHTGAGRTTSGSQNADDVTATIEFSSPTTIVITRSSSATSNTRIAWEIVEYTGPPGGSNEFIVRKQGIHTFAASGNSETEALAGVANVNDLAGFVTGIRNPDTGRNDYHNQQSSISFDDASTVRFQRGTLPVSGPDAVSVLYAIVEFTGSNWNVQRVEHTYSAAGVTETETITPVNSLSRAFIHSQKRVDENLRGLDEFGHEVWLSAANQVSFQLESGSGTPSGHTSVAWIIENTQASGTPMNVERGTFTKPGTGAEPGTVNVNYGPISDLTIASLFANDRSAGTGTSFPHGIFAARLVDTSTIEFWYSDNGQTQNGRWEVVEWPTAPAGANNPPTITSVTDSPDPVDEGNGITFTVDWNDVDAGEQIQIYVCQTDAISGVSQSCPGGSWCDSAVFTTNDPESCAYITQAADGGINNYYAFVCDDSNDCSASTSGTFDVQPAGDLQSPYWFNNVSNTPAVYSPTFISEFNVSWTDNIAVDAVYIEGNWSGTNNYSATPTGDTYTYQTNLPAGTFYWRSWSNDSAGNLNVTDSWTFTANKDSSSCVLNITPPTPSTYDPIPSVTATGSCNNSEISYNLYREGILINDENGVAVSLSVGSYNYEMNSTDTQNYTGASDSQMYVVNQATPTPSLSVLPSNSETYGTQTTVSCSYLESEVTPQLFRDGVLVGNPDINVLAAGVYDYVCNNTATQNYTAAEVTDSLTVNRADHTIHLALDDLESDKSVTYPAVTNATGWLEIGQGSAVLYRDSSVVANPEITTLSVGIYNYSYIYPDSENYTGQSMTRFLTVNRSATVLNLGINPNWNVVYNTSVNVSCYANNNEVVVSLFRNSDDVTSENNQFVVLAAGSYDYTCNNTATQNYTTAETSNTLTINKTIPTPSLVIIPSASEPYGTPTAVTCYYTESEVTAQLYRNDILIANPDIQVFGVGVYDYVCNNTATQNYTAAELSNSVTINQANPTPTLNISSNPATYGDVGSVSCSYAESEVTAQLYRNGVPVSNSDSIQDLAAGSYDYTCNNTATQNYTTNEVTDSLTVNKDSSSCILTIIPASPIIYGISTTATGSCNNPETSYNLYRNGIVVNSENGVPVSLGAGSHYYEVNSTDTQNYTGNSDGQGYVVSQENPTPTLTITPSNSETYGTQTTMSCSYAESEVTAQLYRNYVFVSTPDIQTLGGGSYDYTCNNIATQNYTTNEVTDSLTVSQVLTNINLLLNNTDGNLTIDDGEYVNITVDIGFADTVFIYADNVLLDSGLSVLENITNPGIGLHNITGIYNGNQNYTGSFETHWLTVLAGSPPQFSSHIRSPLQPNEDEDVDIQIKITNDVNVSLVYFEWNSTINYTVTSAGDVYQIILNSGNLTPHDTVSYYWYAFNTNNNMNRSAQFSFIIVNQPPLLITAPALNSTSPQTNDLLVCNSGIFFDPDSGDTQQAAYWMWFVSGVYVSGEQTLDLSLPGNGDKGDSIICSQRVFDGYDNSSWENSSNTAVVIDTQPTAPALISLSDNQNTSDNTPTFTWTTGTDVDNDVLSYEIQISDETNFITLAQSAVVSNTNYTSTPLIDGTYYWRVKSVTQDANSSYTSYRKLTVDTTPPTSLTNYTNNNTWVQSTQTLLVTEMDNIDLNPTTLYCIDQTNSCAQAVPADDGESISVTQQGINYVRIRSTDFTNNNQYLTDVVMIDSVPPTVVLFEPQNTSYTNGSLLLEYNSLDSTSGIDSTWYSLDSGSNTSLSGNTTIIVSGSSHHLVLYARDLAGNEQEIGVDLTVDTTPPISNNPGDAVYVQDISQTIGWILQDNVGPGYYYVERNGTIQNSTAPWINDTNLNIWVNTSELGYWMYTIYFNDSLGFTGTPNQIGITITTSDVSSPIYSGIVTSPSLYAPENDHYFNITWVDDTAIDSVIFEFDGFNYTPLNAGSEYFSLINSLAVGSYNYRWYANDIFDSWNVTIIQTYTVTAATPVLTLSALPSWSEVYGTQTSVNCTDSGQVFVDLYRDGILVSNPDTQNLNTGTYDYVCNSTSTQNYTATEATNTLAISKAPTTTQLFLNDQESDISIQHPTMTNVSAYTPGTTVMLYRNSTIVSNPDINSGVDVLGVGVYNYTAITLEDSNYFGSDTTRWLTVTPGVVTCTLTTEPGATMTYGTDLNITCSCDVLPGTLWRDSVNRTGDSGIFVNLSAGLYDFVCNATNTQNYTAVPDNISVTVNEAENPVSLYINNFLNQNVTINYEDPFNVIGTSAGGIANLFRDEQAVPNPEFGSKILTTGTYEYKTNSTGNENYTDNTTGLMYYLTINKNSTEIVTRINSNRGDTLIAANTGVSFDVILNVPGKTVTLYTELPNWTNQSGVTPLNYITNVTEDYFLVIGSFGGDENYTGSSESHFMNVSASVTPITLYNISHSNVTNTTALITWNTLELTDSAVIYEIFNVPSDIKFNLTLTPFHIILLDNLLPNTTYVYTITSCDSESFCNTSTEFNFTTDSSGVCLEDWDCSGWSSSTCGTRTCTDLNNCGTEDDKPSELLSCPPPGGGGGGGGGSGTEPENDTNKVLFEATRELLLKPGIDIQDDQNLQDASQDVLGLLTLHREYINKLVETSRLIVNRFYGIQHLTVTESKSQLVTSLEYTGDEKLKNFIIYEKIPKGFASSSQGITVYAPNAANHGIVKDDPEYVFIYNEISPGDQIIISYTADSLVNLSLINDTKTEIYAEGSEIVPICNGNDLCELELGENLVNCLDCELADLCTPGELRCLDNNIQICDSENIIWITTEHCPVGCSGDVCAEAPDIAYIIPVFVGIVILAMIGVYLTQRGKTHHIKKKRRRVRKSSR